MSRGGGGCEVHVDGLVVGYRAAGIARGSPVLRGVGLHLAPGTVTAVVGANGAGKTTLLRVLLGFLRPWTGTVGLDGRTPREARRRRGFGYLPEAVQLPAGWRVRAFLREGARLAGAGASTAETHDAGLRPWLDRRTGELSRGVARRVALAFALAGAPPLVVLDEPFAGLDPPSREALAATVRRLREGSTTVLLCSHDLDEVERLADGMIVMAAGRAVLAGPPGAADRARLLAMMSGEGRP